MKLKNSPRPLTPLFALICRLTLSIIFFYAGIEKIINPGDFAVAIYNFRIALSTYRPYFYRGWKYS